MASVTKTTQFFFQHSSHALRTDPDLTTSSTAFHGLEKKNIPPEKPIVDNTFQGGF